MAIQGSKSASTGMVGADACIHVASAITAAPASPDVEELRFFRAGFFPPVLLAFPAPRPRFFVAFFCFVVVELLDCPSECDDSDCDSPSSEDAEEPEDMDSTFARPIFLSSTPFGNDLHFWERKKEKKSRVNSVNSGGSEGPFVRGEAKGSYELRCGKK